MRSVTAALAILPLLALPGCLSADAYYGHAGVLQVDAADVEFAGTVLGETASRSLHIRNIGKGGLDLSMALDKDAADFTVSPATLALDAGDDADVTLSFTATTYADRAGNLTITYADTSADVELSGTVTTDADRDGYDATAAGGTDCDDADREVHPDATDDATDRDCSGVAGDEDGDGTGSLAAGGTDCDDHDSAIYTGAVESQNDLDDDCDGMIDEEFVLIGDIAITEIKFESPAWIELCTTHGVHLDGMTLEGVELPSAWLDGCAAVCESEFADCPIHAPIKIQLVVTLTADTPLDVVPLDSANWPQSGRDVLSLDPLAPDPDSPSAWCVTTGSPGLPNPPCP